MCGEMKSRDKLDIVAKPMPQYGNKLWVLVRFKTADEWIPSFEDLFRIIRAICHCEDVKYPYGKGREMVRELLDKCCDWDADWEVLRAEFQIPARD